VSQAEALDPQFLALLEIIQQRTKRPIYETWFKNLEFVELDDDVLKIGTPNQFVKKWIEDSELLHTLAEAIEEAYERKLTPELLITQRDSSDDLPTEQPDDDEGNSTPATSAIASPLTPSLPSTGYLEHDSTIQLKDDYKFDTFIVGPNNRLAHAAALAVAESPGRTYNPLFIHSAVGLGKTHLLQGICHSLLTREGRPRAKILYLACEDFVNRFIEAVKDGELEQFRYKYRNVDVLVIDDIHFLADKERIQEEFFHTFNALVDQNRQVVVSADKSPSDLEGVEERMRSRLGWGLVADIHPTTYELRLGILQSKAEQFDQDMPGKVLEFLAHKITSNVRELEGALNRIIAHATLVGRPISLETTQEVLHDLLRANDRRVTIEEIQKRVAEHFNIRIADMHSARRARAVARPRQVAMYLSKQLTTRSLPEIGRKFGGRDHTTVMHAVKKVEELKSLDASFDEDVEMLRRMLEG